MYAFGQIDIAALIWAIFLSVKNIFILFMSYSLSAVNQPIKILIISQFLPADTKRYDIENAVLSITSIIL